MFEMNIKQSYYIDEICSTPGARSIAEWAIPAPLDKFSKPTPACFFSTLGLTKQCLSMLQKALKYGIIC